MAVNFIFSSIPIANKKDTLQWVEVKMFARGEFGMHCCAPGAGAFRGSVDIVFITCLASRRVVFTLLLLRQCALLCLSVFTINEAQPWGHCSDSCPL